jgi:integrase
MGSRSKTISRGVRIRTYPSGLQRIEIQFQITGPKGERVQCKEVLPDLDCNKAGCQRAAINLKAEIDSAIRRGAFDYAEYFPKSPRALRFRLPRNHVTVQMIQETLLQDLETAGRESTTMASYRKSAARIDQHLGDILVSALTPEDIRSMVRVRQVSRKTWNNDLIPLRRALNRAVNDGLILFSPLDRVELDELVPRHRKPQPDPFSMGEIEQILTSAPVHCPRAHNLIEFALFTGLRPEELAGLQWDDVDLANRQVHITHAAELSLRRAHLKPPKTTAGLRTVDLLPRAQDALKRQQSVTRFRGLNVFCRWSSLEPFSSYEQLACRWKTILTRAGVRYRPLNHTRHTYASHQLSSGVNALYVASQMGHSGTAMLDIYSTWISDWKTEHQERKYGS